jgi:hypothetical protein
MSFGGTGPLMSRSDLLGFPRVDVTLIGYRLSTDCQGSTWADRALGSETTVRIAQILVQYYSIAFMCYALMVVAPCTVSSLSLFLSS